MPVEARFSAPIKTDPVAHPASCTRGTGSFPGVKLPGRGVDHTPPSIAKIKEKVHIYISSSFVVNSLHSRLQIVVDWKCVITYKVCTGSGTSSFCFKFTCDFVYFYDVDEK
jgi:hypothetical protein